MVLPLSAFWMTIFLFLDKYLKAWNSDAVKFSDGLRSLNFLTEDLNRCERTILGDLREEIDHISIRNKRFSSKNTFFSKKLIAFSYSNMVKFCETSKVKRIPLSQKFVEDIIVIMEDNVCIHHSHVTGEIKGYAHYFCNEKARENYFKIPVIAYNLFMFDFFFLLKGLRSGISRTRDITIAGRNPTDINFASIGNQIQFVDTIKYFQQSLAALASSLTDKEKGAIYIECEKYLLSDLSLSKGFLLCTKDEKKWVLGYLSSGKETILYELITEFDPLNMYQKKNFFYLTIFIRA